MHRLLAIRHGQASYGTDDYDRLSALGWQQSRQLGNWLAGHGIRFQHVVCGAMRRHRETLQAIAEGYAARGIPLPAAEVDADLNEFDHLAVINAYHARQAATGETSPAALSPSDHSAVMRMLLQAIGLWASGELDTQVDESWQAFGDRVQRAGRGLGQRLSDGAVLAVSSAGTLSRLAQLVMEAPSARAVELSIGLRNSAQSEFFAIGRELRLGSWNSLPHLSDQPALWTHY